MKQLMLGINLDRSNKHLNDSTRFQVSVRYNYADSRKNFARNLLAICEVN